MNLTALLFVVLIGPSAITWGYIELTQADCILRVSARAVRWSWQPRSDRSSAWAPTSGVYRRIVTRSTDFLDRAGADPGQFPLFLRLLRIQGAIFVIWGSVATIVGALSL